MTTSDQEFRPDWASSPGDTILDILRERNLPVADFAHLMGDTVEATADLLQGRATITLSTARRLKQVLGSSVEFWMTRDYQFREEVARLRAADEEWLHELPIGDMIKFGWLSPAPHPSEELAACLRFFGQPSVAAWYTVYTGLHQLAAFRISASFESRPASVAVWLRQGEIQAGRIDCGVWDEARLRKSLPLIRSLTRQHDPSAFVPKLQRVCAESGVAVVVVRAPSGCSASGAVRFLSSDKAILQLSFRYLTDDHFWFTFFHEVGHLLLHGERDFFTSALGEESHWILEGVDPLSSNDEQEANEFAARVLIPSEFQSELESLPPNALAVIRFAVRVGVSPGVVVGQLQHLGKIGYDQLNRLKRRYRWDD